MADLTIHADNIKPWLKSVFEVASGRQGEVVDFKLKAIDLELANGLCLNEIKLFKQQKAENHEEQAIKVYAYLVVKLSQALSRGEVCIDFSQLYDFEQRTGIVRTELNEYLTRFTTVHTISVEQQEELAQLNPYTRVINYPLVVMQGRMYFSRYWFYQQQVFFSISSRLSNHLDQAVNQTDLGNILQLLFPESSTNQQPNWQMLAAANACLNHFSVITGGPGTGKTTTVTRLLAALISQQPNLRIALAAPTGKAAARLIESILAAKFQLAQTFPLAEKIPVSSFTLHRLLG